MRRHSATESKVKQHTQEQQLVQVAFVVKLEPAEWIGANWSGQATPDFVVCKNLGKILGAPAPSTGARPSR